VTDTTRRVVAGAGWLYGHRWIERLLDFAAVAVLARMLSPSDFGLVAIAASVVAIVEGLGAFGIDKALIRSREDDRELYDSAWTLSLLRGMASAAVMVGIAQVLSDVRIGAVLLALAWAPVFTGLANPRFVTFERDLLYSRFAVLTLGAKLASVAATLAVAVALRSHWALVIGLLVNAFASMVLSYVLRPYRPRVSFARFHDLFAFSGWLTLTSAVTALSMETDRIIVGRVLGITDAGLYDMTQRVGVLPTRELLSPLQRLLLPAFSQWIHDLPRLRRAASESINVLASLSLPAAFGFALVAGDFVPLILGSQWMPIAPLLIVLVPYLGLRSTLSMTLPCVLALGDTRMLFRVSFVYALVHVPTFVVGTAMFGLAGAIWSIVAAGTFYIYLNVWMLKQALAIPARDILSQMRRPFAATAVMSAAVGALLAATPLELLPASGSWRSAAVKVASGAAVWGASQYGIWRLEGRPPGIERRLLQLLSRQAPR
jgi:lipopolysaccharide exporter